MFGDRLETSFIVGARLLHSGRTKAGGSGASGPRCEDAQVFCARRETRQGDRLCRRRTVEFIYDAASDEFYFIEMNTASRSCIR